MKKKFLVVSLSLFVISAFLVQTTFAGMPSVVLTTPGAGIDSITGDPTGTGSEAGIHSIVVTGATVSTLTGGVAEHATATSTMALGLTGTEVLTLTIGGTPVTTAALSAATAGTTLLADVATDIEIKINAATTAPDVDVEVIVVGISPNKGFKIMVDLAGVSNSITGQIIGSGAVPTALAGVNPVAGTDAKAVDTFSANSGSNNLWVAANPGSTKTIAHATSAGTASTLAGLKTLVIAAGAFIEGVSLVASGVLSAGTAVVTVSPGTASYLKVTGTANFAAGANNELTITAYDDVANKDTAYAGNKNLIFSGLAVIGVNNPTVEGVNFGTATVVAFTAGASNANAATLVAKKTETASVDVSDGTINSFGNAAYDLDVVVSPAAKNKLIFTGQPSSLTAVNTAFATQPIVAIQDTYGNTTTDTDTVTLSSFSDSACIAVFTGLDGILDKAAVAGVANFSGNGVKFSTQAGSLYLKASSGGLTTACTSPAVAIIYAPSSSSGPVYVATQPAPETPTTPITRPTLPYPTPTTATEMQANIVVLQTYLLSLFQQLLVLLQVQLQSLLQ